MELTKIQKEALIFLREGGRFEFIRTISAWVDAGFSYRTVSSLHDRNLITVYKTEKSKKYEVWSYGLSQLGKQVLGMEIDHSNKVAGALSGVGKGLEAGVQRNFRDRVMATLLSLEGEVITESQRLSIKIARRALDQISPLAFRVAVQAAKGKYDRKGEV